MSPEQCEAKPVTGASDQYSLGIVAFEMLTGKLPFEGDSAVTTMYKHCHEELPPLDDFRPDCPAELRETVVRMVAKDPANRWPSLEAAIRKLHNDPTPTGVDPIRGQLLELVREGDADQLLARLSDPSGPLTGHARGAPPAPARSRSGALAAAGVVAVLGVAGTLAVMQPWAAGDPPPDTGTAVSDAAQAVEGQPTPAAQEPVGPGAVIPSSGNTAPVGPDGGPAGAAIASTPNEQPTDTRGGPGTAGRGSTPPTTAAVVASVDIFGAPDWLEAGASAALRGIAVDAGGIAVPGSPPLRWASSDETVARVDPNGVVTALAPGQVVLTASSGRGSGSVRLTVADRAVATIVLDRASLELTVGGQGALEAQPRAGDGGTLTGRAMNWLSSDETVARVSGTGQVTAVGPGTATITVSSEGISTTAAVAVRVDIRTAAEELVGSYARALESRDVAQVRVAYPGITGEREAQLRTALRDMDGLRVEYTIDSLQEQDATATAVVSATYRFRGGGRDQLVPVPLTFSFSRTPTGWRVSGIQ
jgi:hypothetical protein